MLRHPRQQRRWSASSFPHPRSGAGRPPFGTRSLPAGGRSTPGDHCGAPGLANNSFYCFSLLFVKYHRYCLAGKSLILQRGEYCSFSFFPTTPSSTSRTLEWLFELTRRPSRALNLPRACFRNFRESRTQSGMPRARR